MLLYLTVSEVARMVGTTPENVRLMSDRGEIPVAATTSHRDRLYLEDQIREYASTQIALVELKLKKRKVRRRRKRLRTEEQRLNDQLRALAETARSSSPSEAL